MTIFKNDQLLHGMFCLDMKVAGLQMTVIFTLNQHSHKTAQLYHASPLLWAQKRPMSQSVQPLNISPADGEAGAATIEPPPPLLITSNKNSAIFRPPEADGSTRAT